MALSHICPRCGIELARQRVTERLACGIDAIVCRGCGFAVVRRAHGGTIWLVRSRKRMWALALLTLNGLLLFAALGLNFFLVDEMDLLLRRHLVWYHPQSSFSTPLSDVYMAFGITCGATVTGIWYTIVMAHIRLWKRPLVWLLWLGGTSLFFFAWNGARDVYGDWQPVGEVMGRGEFLPLALLVVWGLSLIGVGPGVFVSRVIASGSRRHWKRLLAKHQRERA